MDRAEQITDRAQSGENCESSSSVSVLMSDDSIRMVRWWVDWSLHICGIRWVRWVPATHQPLTLLTPNQPVAFLIACAGHFVLLCCNVTATLKGKKPYPLLRPHPLYAMQQKRHCNLSTVHPAQYIQRAEVGLSGVSQPLSATAPLSHAYIRNCKHRWN